jgi:hypothetical protein
LKGRSCEQNFKNKLCVTAAKYGGRGKEKRSSPGFVTKIWNKYS